MGQGAGSSIVTHILTSFGGRSIDNPKLCTLALEKRSQSGPDFCDRWHHGSDELRPKMVASVSVSAGANCVAYFEKSPKLSRHLK